MGRPGVFREPDGQTTRGGRNSRSQQAWQRMALASKADSRAAA
jgi:hypothetical protein